MDALRLAAWEHHLLSSRAREAVIPAGALVNKDIKFDLDNHPEMFSYFEKKF